MSEEKDINKDNNRTLKVYTKISDETGVRIEMVHHIHKSLSRERKNDVQISSKNATTYIIQDLINKGKGSVLKILTYNGIKSSEDFGAIVKLLCDEGVLLKEEDDNYDDFIGLFTLGTIENFIKDNKLTERIDWYKKISHSLSFVGFAIVILSYLTQVPNKTGWVGWGIGMFGWIFLTYRKKIETYSKKLLRGFRDSFDN